MGRLKSSMSAPKSFYLVRLKKLPLVLQPVEVLLEQGEEVDCPALEVGVDHLVWLEEAEECLRWDAVALDRDQVWQLHLERQWEQQPRSGDAGGGGQRLGVGVVPTHGVEEGLSTGTQRAQDDTEDITEDMTRLPERELTFKPRRQGANGPTQV